MPPARRGTLKRVLRLLLMRNLSCIPELVAGELSRRMIRGIEVNIFSDKYKLVPKRAAKKYKKQNDAPLQPGDLTFWKENIVGNCCHYLTNAAVILFISPG